MKKKYISDEWKLKQKGHENFDFVDVAVNDDNLLFIDPCLIGRWNDAWAIKAMKHINSYFDNLFKAYSTGYTVENNDGLDEYHRKLPGFYMEHGKSMTDEDLDFVIYGYVVAKSA